MGIFGINYEKEGPGVRKDEPQKKGIRRFSELLRREFSSLVKVNLAFSLFLAPSLALFIYNYFYAGNSILLLVLAVILAFPVGGAWTAAMYCISIMLLDESRHVIYDFRRKFKENVIQSSPFGIIYLLFMYLQIYVWTGMLFGSISPGFMVMMLLVVALILTGMIVPYIFLQIGHLVLKSKDVLKNSIFIAIRYMPKSLLGILFSLLHWIISFLFYPLSVWWSPLLLFVGFSLSFLIDLMFIWPPVDLLFSVGKTIRERREAELNEITPVFTNLPKFY